MTRPEPQGWCPTAYRPMLSGDGYLVRIRPKCSEIMPLDLLELCDLADAFGNGFLSLTQRANIQLRGVTQQNIDPLNARLCFLGLIDPNKTIEALPQLLVSPFWVAGSGIDNLYDLLLAELPSWPRLPAKFGIALGAVTDQNATSLAVDFDCSADIRVYLDRDCYWIWLQGSPLAFCVQADQLHETLRLVVDWFAARRTADIRRMSSLVEELGCQNLIRQVGNPEQRFVKAVDAITVGRYGDYRVLGVPFGMTKAATLRAMIAAHSPEYIRVTPWRSLALYRPRAEPEVAHFCAHQEDPRLRILACPGSPFCHLAKGETLSLAQICAEHGVCDLHISGCAKGCAEARRSYRTVLPKAHSFDLVAHGHAWDEPDRRDLDFDTLVRILEQQNAV